MLQTFGSNSIRVMMFYSSCVLNNEIKDQSISNSMLARFDDYVNKGDKRYAEHLYFIWY